MDKSILDAIFGDDIDVSCLHKVAKLIISGDILDAISNDPEARACVVRAIGIVIMAGSSWIKKRDPGTRPVFGAQDSEVAWLQLGYMLGVDPPMHGAVGDTFRQLVWQAFLSLIEAKLPDWIDAIEKLAEGE